MEEKKNSLAIPIAIIVAALIIAGGVYISKTNTSSIQSEKTQLPSIQMDPITSTDHILGNPSAPIVLVEFTDLECPYCKVFEGTMNTLMSTYGRDGNLAWVYRHFPLWKPDANGNALHPKAEKEAEASECANQLGGNPMFWRFTEAIFATTTSNNTLDPKKLPKIAGDLGLDVTKFNDCLSSGKYAPLIETEYQDGLKAGARGTPYNVLVLKNPVGINTVNAINSYTATNGLTPYITITPDNKFIIINGALPFENINKIIEIILKN